MGDASTAAAFGPGELLSFERGTVHALPTITQGPMILLSIDTPRRAPTDIIFVDPADGAPRDLHGPQRPGGLSTARGRWNVEAERGPERPASAVKFDDQAILFRISIASGSLRSSSKRAASVRKFTPSAWMSRAA